MILAIAQLAAAVPAAEPASATGEEAVEYVVRRGDTLEALSRDYLVPQRHWRDLAKLTGTRDPRRLPAGRTITIPRSWLRFRIEPARLASFRGTVAITLQGRPIANVVGANVGEGAQIGTAANSFVTLLLADRSKIVIPSNSRVRVRQLRRILLTGTIDYRIDVEAGRLETQVTPIDDSTGRYRIDTPVSMTAVRGTEYRVAFDESRRVAAAEVLDGIVAVSSAAGTGELLVERGFGAGTDASGESRITALLPAPALADPGRVQAEDEIGFEALPLAGASAYRAVVAADAGFIENLSEQISETGVFSLDDIPNGNLFVRVSAIASDGLEGLAQSYSFRRQLASIRAQIEQLGDEFRFRWSGAGTGKRQYRFQLMRGSRDGRAIVDEVALAQDTLTLRDLPPDVYFWRVGVTQYENGEDVDNWTDFEKLTITSPGN